MNRQEIYAYIREHDGMAEQIKREFGKNYTLCRNADLEAYVNKYGRNHAFYGDAGIQVCVDRHVKPAKEESVIDRLVTVLRNKRILIKAEVDYILGK